VPSSLSGCLKIKNSAITQPAAPQNDQQNFVKDMKKHGIIKDIQDVNSLSQIIMGSQGEHDGKSGSSNAQQHQ
jgi:hypothetical protein